MIRKCSHTECERGIWMDMDEPINRYRKSAPNSPPRARPVSALSWPAGVDREDDAGNAARLRPKAFWRGALLIPSP